MLKVMYLIFDTETTGLPNKFLPASDRNQARVLQIAAVQLDEKFSMVSAIKTLIQPDGWSVIDPKAFEAHHITLAECQKRGAPMLQVLKLLESWVNSSSVIIAHNIVFDKQMLEIECKYFGQSPFITENSKHKLFCTMAHSTEICKIPHPKWPNKNKWPKVKEAYKHFMGKEPEGQHDAFGDVSATAVIFQKLHELGIVKVALA